MKNGMDNETENGTDNWMKNGTNTKFHAKLIFNKKICYNQLENEWKW